MSEKISATAMHQWAATGVSGYPLRHPIVGQRLFFETFRHFIHLVDQEAERFAHVFAIVAQWGVGKSRLAYELISQINSASPGWFLRDAGGGLVRAELFDGDADREQYLGLYIRYGQIATPHHNSDNWFAYGLYRALQPLARGTFDESIQGRIASEAYDRLLPLGFDEAQLAAALEVEREYSDAQLYEDPDLATRLCRQAYEYLSRFGIRYLLIALDELETVAETATYGLDPGDIKHLDGRAIKLMGKAIKEEDPRRRLPWLRYVALCSPAIGDELRDIKSTARRFEMVELANNAFADVSDFVRTLAAEGRLTESYPAGLVEAAYAMSGGNFGWFNVIMANVDEVLRARRVRGETGAPTLGELFAETVRVSSRMRDYVLDQHAIDELKLTDRSYRTVARELLYGQLPVALSAWKPEEQRALIEARNEFDEPAALLYRRIEIDDLVFGEAMRKAKFVRDNEVWRLAGVDQPLDLRQLLANLSTYAIHEKQAETAGRRVLLLPLRGREFAQLIALLYPHPAAEDAARALWREIIGDRDLDSEEATHIGPSIAMLERLNLRYRRQSHNALIFRDPDEADAYEKAFAARRTKGEEERISDILTGTMRLLDRHWTYTVVSAGLRNFKSAIATAAAQGNARGGLVTCDALKLHPRGRLIVAWVRSEEDLETLCRDVSTQFREEGRTPVLALTPSMSLVDRFNNPASETLRAARGYLLLYQVSASEELILQQTGLPRADWKGFEFSDQRFTSAFSNRLNALLRPLMEEAHRWRQRIGREGRIAWPLRAGGALRDNERDLLFQAWRELMNTDTPALARLDERSDNDPDAVVDVLKKTVLTPQIRAAGYQDEEAARLFSSADDGAEAIFPPLLLTVLKGLLRGDGKWSFDTAEAEWFWGYTWLGAKPREIFKDWMALACDLGFATPAAKESGQAVYRLRSLSELGNLIQEADNWLRDDYPQIIERLTPIFGPGKVGDYFNPLSANPPGTKTLEAKRRIEKGREDFTAIERAEEVDYKRARNDAETTTVLIESMKRRRSLLEGIEWVYDLDKYRVLEAGDFRRELNFEDDELPLWERVRRAEQFAEFAENVRERILRGIDAVSEQMQTEAAQLRGFPLNLFTLSLAKIGNILKGAMSAEPAEGETQQKQMIEAGTLRQCLRDLKISEARDKLQQLAREVGVRLDSPGETPFAEIDGQIAQGFRQLRRGYAQLIDQLKRLTAKLDELEAQLKDAPQDFEYPEDLPPFANLRKRPQLIEGLIDELREEEVDRLRDQFDAPARLGNFQPLMSAAQELLTEPKTAIQQLSGHVLTLENAVTGYLQSLLAQQDVRSIEEALNALRRAAGLSIRNRIDLPALQAAGSLRAARSLIDERRSEWTREGEEMLSGAGVDFARWRQIVADLNAGRDLLLDSKESDELVARGFLKRTYRLGGEV